MNGIAPFQSGRPLLSELTADKLNRILDEIKRNRPLVSAPLSARVTGDGTHISIKKSVGGGTATAREPWDLLAQVDPAAAPENETPPYLVRVRAGTLNGILPTNWDEEFECAGSGLHYAKAVVATDGQAITGVTIAIDVSGPATQTPVVFGVANPVEYLFGIFLEGAVYRVIGDGHISISPKLWLTTERASPPAAGDLPFRQFFTLR